MPPNPSRTVRRFRQPRPAPGQSPLTPGPEAVRRRILHTAEEHFLTHGFSHVTMGDLATEMAMSKKTLYQHFPSKAALLDSVLEERLAGIGRQTARLVGDQSRDFSWRLQAVLDYLSRRLAEVKPPFLLDVKRSAPEMFRKIEDFRRQKIPLLFGQLLEEGLRLGLVRHDLDGRVIVELVLNAIQAIIHPDTLTRLGISAQEGFSTILSVVLEGILAPEGRKILARTKEAQVV